MMKIATSAKPKIVERKRSDCFAEHRKDSLAPAFNSRVTTAVEAHFLKHARPSFEQG